MKPIWRSTVAALLSAFAAAHLQAAGDAKDADADTAGTEQTDRKSDSDAKKEKQAPKPLPAEVEAKLREFLESAKKTYAGFANKVMKDELDELDRLCKLDGSSVKALQAVASEAADRSATECTADVEKSYREWATKVTKQQLLQTLSQVFANTDNLVEADVGMPSGPTEDPAWKAAVEKTLTRDQRSLVTEARARKIAEIEKEAGELLKKMLTQLRRQSMDALQSRIDEIALTIQLPSDRLKELDQLAKSLVDEFADRWRSEALKRLARLSAENRQRIIKSGNLFFPSLQSESPVTTKAWEEGVAKVIGEDGLRRLEVYENERDANRAKALANMGVCVLDQHVGFTASQREAVRPILERRVIEDQKNAAKNSRPASLGYTNGGNLFAIAEKVDPKEIRPLLDDRQWKRWREVCGLDRNAGPPNTGEQDTPSTEKNKSGTDPSDPEYMDDAVSTQLLSNALNARDYLVSRLTLRAEEIARAAALSPEAAESLITAAKGAAEAELADQESNWEQMIRASFKHASPEMLVRRQQSFGLSDPIAESRAPIWKKAFATLLSPQQTEAYNAAEKARRDFRYASATEMILTTLADSEPISAEQKDKLKPLVMKALDDYSPDMEQTFGGETWFFQGFTRLLPFAAIPENDVDQVLTKTQRDHLNGAMGFQNAKAYLPMLKQRHEQRLKEEAKAAETKSK